MDRAQNQAREREALLAAGCIRSVSGRVRELDPRIRETFACRIRNTPQGIRNATND